MGPGNEPVLSLRLPLTIKCDISNRDFNVPPPITFLCILLNCRWRSGSLFPLICEDRFYLWDYSSASTGNPPQSLIYRPAQRLGSVTGQIIRGLQNPAVISAPGRATAGGKGMRRGGCARRITKSRMSPEVKPEEFGIGKAEEEGVKIVYRPNFTTNGLIL